MSSSRIAPEGQAALLRQIPPVDELLGRPGLRDLETRFGRPTVTGATREVLEKLRQGIAQGQVRVFSRESLERDIVAAVELAAEPSLRSVINATGVILHTNLGRAPLAPEAVAHL